MRTVLTTERPGGDVQVRRLTHLGGVQSRPVARGDAAAQQAHLVQRGLRVHFGQRDLSHHSELGEGAAAHEVEEALAFAGETGRPVWHQAFTLSDSGERDTKTTVHGPQGDVF